MVATTTQLGMSIWDRFLERGSPAVNFISDVARAKLATIFPGGDNLNVGQQGAGMSLSNLFSGLDRLSGSASTIVFGATSTTSIFGASSAGEFEASSTTSIQGDSSPAGSYLSVESSGEFLATYYGDGSSDPVVFGGSYSDNAFVFADDTDLVSGLPTSAETSSLVEDPQAAASLVEDPQENDDDPLKSYFG